LALKSHGSVTVRMTSQTISPDIDGPESKTDIIFVSYNSKTHVRRCFSTLEDTTEKYNAVIVIDNHSKPETVEELRRCGSLITRGKYVLHLGRENSGYARALNRGIALSEAPFLVFGNMDIAFHPGWLPPLIRELQDPEVGFVGGKSYDGRGRLYSCGIGPTEEKRRHRGIGKRDRGQYDRVEDVVSVSGALFASRRDVFERIGGFDENFFLYFEETEIHIRARRAGYRVVYTPRSSYTHYLGKSSSSVRKREIFRKSEEYFNKKLGLGRE